MALDLNIILQLLNDKLKQANTLPQRSLPNNRLVRTMDGTYVSVPNPALYGNSPDGPSPLFGSLSEAASNAGVRIGSPEGRQDIANLNIDYFNSNVPSFLNIRPEDIQLFGNNAVYTNPNTGQTQNYGVIDNTSGSSGLEVLGPIGDLVQSLSGASPSNSVKNAGLSLLTGGNPMTTLLGGLNNPLSALLGGSSNPLSALTGGGSNNPLSALAGGDLSSALGLSGLIGGLGSQLSGLESALGGQISGLTGRLQGLQGQLGGLGSQIGDLLGSNLQGLQSTFGSALSGLQGELGGLANIVGTNFQGLQNSLGSGLQGLQSSLGGALSGLQGELGGLADILGTNLQGLQGTLQDLPGTFKTNFENLNDLITSNAVGAQNSLSTEFENLKNFIESNTTDFADIETFLNSDTGNLLKAGTGLTLANQLLGQGEGGLGALLGAGGLGSLLGGGTIPGLGEGGTSDLKDFLLGRAPSVEKFQEDLFSQGQQNLFSQLAAPGRQNVSSIDTQGLQNILNQNFFGNLPTSQTQLPTFTNQFAQANIGNQTLPNIPTQSSNIQTDFLSSLIPQGQQQSVLNDATTQYAQGLGQTPLNTFQSLQDVSGQTQALDDYFTTNIQNPLLENFQENILPGISRRFAGGNQFFGSERQRADELAQENLLDTLAQERSRLGFEQFGQARDRALQAAGAQAGAQTAAQGLQTQEALGRGQLSLQDLLGRGGLILEQGLGTQGQQLQADQFGQQGAIAGGNQLIQALQTNQQAEQLNRQSLLDLAGLGQQQDRFNLESALQAATGQQQGATTLADLLFRSQQANQQAQLAQNSQLAQILGIPQLENAFVSLPGSEGLLPGLLAGAAGGLGAALPALLSDEREKDDIKLADEDIEELLDNLGSWKYKYKDPKYGEGERISVMAQELEKSKIGKRMVTETEDGKKFVEYSVPLMLAVQANLNKRLRKLGV